MYFEHEKISAKCENYATFAKLENFMDYVEFVIFEDLFYTSDKVRNT